MKNVFLYRPLSKFSNFPYADMHEDADGLKYKFAYRFPQIAYCSIVSYATLRLLLENF